MLSINKIKDIIFKSPDIEYSKPLESFYIQCNEIGSFFIADKPNNGNILVEIWNSESSKTCRLLFKSEEMIDILQYLILRAK